MQPLGIVPDISHEVSGFEREVRRGAVVNKMRRRFRRIALSRPIPGWWLRNSTPIYQRRDVGDPH